MKIVKVEYWIDGLTSAYQVEKKEYYNSYLVGVSKFLRLIFSDSSEKYVNQ